MQAGNQRVLVNLVQKNLHNRIDPLGGCAVHRIFIGLVITEDKAYDYLKTVNPIVDV
jgi:hypothetical protein